MGLYFAFLAISLYINYQFNFDDLILRSQQGFTKFFFYFLFYASAYYVTLLTVCLSKKNNLFQAFQLKDEQINSI
jgi:hypothetical protein